MRNLTVNISPEVFESARYAVERLESLYPLTQAEQLINDVHFGDNMQVRQTYEIAKLLLDSDGDADVTIADAEYVFEGAQEIPGRSQDAVDALLTANDAYEQAFELYDDFSGANVLQVAACVGAGAEISADLDVLERIIDEYNSDVFVSSDNAGLDSSNDSASSSDVYNLIVAWKLAYELTAAIKEHSDDDFSPEALMVLLVNGYLESHGSPRILATASELVDVYQSSISDDILSKCVVSAAQVWNYHHDEILWDKDEAKRKAKEEDERKSKEALAAKFAHIKNDPDKEEVEL